MLIRFVSDRTKEKIKSSSTKEDDKELNEPDYDEGRDQLEEEQEEEAGENNDKSSFLKSFTKVSAIRKLLI